MENKKKFLGAGSAVIAILAVLFLLVGFTNKKVVDMKLKGDEYQIMDLFSEYEEQGYDIYVNDKLLDDNKDYTVIINTNDLKPNEVGTYYVTYNIEGHPDKNLTRTVKVVDTVAPELKLVEADIKVFEKQEYKEPGFTAIDNYDGDISDKVKVTGSVDTKVIGDYELIYEVADSSGNTVSLTRKVSVIKNPKRPIVKPIKKPETIKPKDNVVDKVVDDSENKKDEIDKDKITYSNEIKEMKHSGSKLSFKGVSDVAITSVGLLANGSEDVVAEVATKVNGKEYSFTLDLARVPDGTYTLVAVNLDNAPILENNKGKDRIGTASFASKNATITYPKNNIVIKIAPLSYAYDIAIQVGHGGNDNGASGNGYIEKELNLMVSLYEKARFEELGMRVFISRNNNSYYGDLSGDTSFNRVTRAAIKFGEVAAKSRASYSNHHNSSTNTRTNGWQIIVANQATTKDLAIEHAVARGWSATHPTKNGTMYGRDYDKETIHNKLDGTVYNKRNYYAMIREPYERNNVYVSIYEMAFLSNKAEINAYMTKDMWKEIAEAKVKAYAEGLGFEYWGPISESVPDVVD